MPFQDGATAKGVQPVIGMLLGIRRPDRGDGSFTRDWLAVYAQDAAGYDNLCRLASMAHLDRPDDLDAHVTLEQLAGKTEGLIVLTAGGEGALARLLAEEQVGAAAEYLENLQQLFPRAIVYRAQPPRRCGRNRCGKCAYRLGICTGIAAGCHQPRLFAEPEFFDAHDAMLCIADGEYIENDDRRKSSRETWIKTGKQMQALFADLPEALANSMVIAQRCTAVSPKRDPILPSLAGNRSAETSSCATTRWRGWRNGSKYWVFPTPTNGRFITTG